MTFTDAIPWRNPVTRGDVRARLKSPKMLWALRLYVAALGILAFLALPPESGRLPQLQEVDLMTAFLAVQIVFGVYLISAAATGEIAVDGEKAVADLAMSAFSPGTIALGKVGTSAASAVGLIAAALPPLLLAGFTADVPFVRVAFAEAAIVPVAAAIGALGAWLAAASSGDFVRTTLHWIILAVLFVIPRWLPEPLAALAPLRLAGAALGGSPGAWPLYLTLYVAVGAVAAVLTVRTVADYRREDTT